MRCGVCHATLTVRAYRTVEVGNSNNGKRRVPLYHPCPRLNDLAFHPARANRGPRVERPGSSAPSIPAITRRDRAETGIPLPRIGPRGLASDGRRYNSGTPRAMPPTMTTRNAKQAKSTMTKDQAIVVLAKHGLDTREGAIAAYGDRVAAKWGESEREHGLAKMRGMSHGRIANSVAVFDVAAVDLPEVVELRNAVKLVILTGDDWGDLRKGG